MIRFLSVFNNISFSISTRINIINIYRTMAAKADLVMTMIKPTIPVMMYRYIFLTVIP